MTSVYQSRRTVRRVTEVMTDLALCELAGTVEPFAEALAQLVGLPSNARVVSVRQSVHESSLGETDVEIVYAHGNVRIAVLIENKIRAPIMPDQFARYRARGEDGVTRGTWDSYRTVLVSPNRYTDALPSEHKIHLDTQIAYEWLVEWLKANDEGQLAFKRHLFAEAIEDAREGYTKRRDNRMTAFHQSVWSIADAEYPQLRMNWVEKAGHDDSLIHLPDALPVRGDKLTLKAKMGRAELRLDTKAPIDMEAALRPLVPLHWRTTRAKGYAGIEISIEPIQPARPFDENEAAVRRFLDALAELHAFYGRREVARVIEAHRGKR